ncbi:turripeptide Pal9.2 [Aethina tumida]|uniref:turripeptide Pal9.2 n=1 Tax=Aethina tumida TaxID=116153 RepID=UPI00096B2772|nr:turripeptide Pal9.2 [Aethina tumida]
MKFSIVFCIFLVGLVAVTYGSPAKGSTKASLKKKPCMKDCGDNYKPVCAGDGKDKPRSYGSECVLSNFNCESGNDYKIISQGECPGGGGVRLQ